MKATTFDPQTGKPLVDHIDGIESQREKAISHSYLEHWLDQHHLPKDDFWVGAAYQSNTVDAIDTAQQQQSLEAEGKYLVYSNGKDGYFTNAEMAELMGEGNPACGIEPIFANDRNSAHNSVAYGSLVSSDGFSSTSLGSRECPARLLVIDDERRDYGPVNPFDPDGRLDAALQKSSTELLEGLLDKMGDGTMLVSHEVMKQLVTEQEREALRDNVMAKHGVASDRITDLMNDDLDEVEASLAEAESKENRFVGRLVTQFRAASTEMPGIAKGTMQTSQWADRLGVDAIISTNDIKGDDGRFSTPGLHEVSNFFINRKSDAEYGTQLVGPQVKGTIQDATLHELNPQMKQQAEELATMASDPRQLLQHYVEIADKQKRLRAADGLGDRPDWIYEVGTLDEHGVLDGFSKLNRGLGKKLRNERVDVATHGIKVPSAMAQHHAQLKPWEVANKDLPQDAIVAYYRSPFPNVGAAAIAINNPAAIKETDPEAFHKHGVAYLPPWTAKNVAITDFDSDRNGFFVGFEAQENGLAARVREQLAETESLFPAEQYEAGRSLFAQMADQAIEDPDHAPVRPVEDGKGFPVVVKEFIDRNAPDQKPAEITKQKKIKHPWDQEGESRQEAIYRAWQITSNNPTGKVANAGMTLQSLAAQTEYVPDDKKAELVGRISKSYQGLLKSARDGKLHIPSNEEFMDKGFQPLNLEARIQSLANGDQELAQARSPEHRAELIDEKLGETRSLLTDFVDGPNAVNLQTAVDVAKSARGIDEDVHALAKRLAYQKDELREHHKDHRVYTNGRSLPSNIDDPINWAVRDANALYQDSQLTELPNETYKDLFPKDYTEEQEREALAIAQQYNELNKQASNARERLKAKDSRDRQPTLTIESERGNQLKVQRLLEVDPKQDVPIWRADGTQAAGDVVRLEPKAVTKQSPETVQAILERDGQDYLLGPVAPESVEVFSLDSKVAQPGGFRIDNPKLTVNPAYSVQNDYDQLFEKAANYLDEAVAQIPEDERMAYASAMWRHSDSMGVVLKKFTPELSERLQEPMPAMTVTGLQYNEVGQIPDGEYTIKVSENTFESKTGPKTSPSISLIGEDGSEKNFGTIAPRSLRPTNGTVAQAEITTEGKVAKLQITAWDDEMNTDVESKPVDPDHPDFEEMKLTDLQQWAEEHEISAEQVQAFGDLRRGSTWRDALGQLSGQLDQQIDAAVPSTVRQEIDPASQSNSPATEQAEAQHYHPSRQELLDWHQSATRQGDTTKVQTIVGVGQQLSVAYQEVGNEGTPPLDYRSEDVTLSPDQAQQMNRDVAMAQRHSDRSIAMSRTQMELPPDPLVEISGKPVGMDFPLMKPKDQYFPVSSTIDAMRGYGRNHTTRNFEPHKAYNFKEGDVAIAQDKSGKQVAFKVGEQYKITPEMVQDAQFQQEWAEGEKHSPEMLPKLFTDKPEVWGMKMEPLGDYKNGRVEPFPAHQPSRQELAGWHTVATAQQDFDKVGIITQKGKQLLAEYQQATGHITRPPNEFRSPNITLSPGQVEQMTADINAHQQQSQAVIGQLSVECDR